MATDRGQWALQGGTTGLTMIPPVGHAQRDRHVLWAINKLEDKVPVISGLSALASQVVGLVAAPAVDVGQQRITVWEFDEGASQGNVTISVPLALNALGGGYGVTPAADEVFKPSTVLFGDDQTSGTAFAALMASNQGFALNDRIIQIATFTHGNPGLPGRGITLPGCTLNSGGSTGVNSAPQNATGNHQYTYTDVGTVTAGAQSAAATAVGTTTTPTTGGAAHVRVSAYKSPTFGVATETDAAQPLGRLKSRAALTALETDAAQSMGRRKSRALGIATEADTALPLGRRKSRLLGIATETSAAQALGRWKTYLIGAAFESDAAIALGRLKRRLLGVAGEVDAARPITAPVEAPEDLVVFGRVRPDQFTGAVRPAVFTTRVRDDQFTGGNRMARTLSPGSVDYVWAEVTFRGLSAAGIAGIGAQIQFTTSDAVSTSWMDATLPLERIDLPTQNGVLYSKLSIAYLVTAVLGVGEASTVYRIWVKLSTGVIVPCGQYTVR